MTTMSKARDFSCLSSHPIFPLRISLWERRLFAKAGISFSRRVCQKVEKRNRSYEFEDSAQFLEDEWDCCRGVGFNQMKVFMTNGQDSLTNWNIRNDGSVSTIDSKGTSVPLFSCGSLEGYSVVITSFALRRCASSAFKIAHISKDYAAVSVQGITKPLVLIASMQFATGMETEASFLLPFPSKYITIDKRYKFSERPNSTSLFMDYPLSESKYTRKWCYGRKSYLSVSRSSSCLVMAAGRTIPDVVLLTVFKYLHPMDLVNGASYVSKRWNLLSKTPSLYRHVRVLVNKQSVNYESAKEFLQRVRSHVGRLCLVYEQGVFADVLPDSMPNVTTLDIGFFPEIADAAEKLITCFPSIETLNMEDVKNVDAAVVRRLFCEGSFRRLRRLCFRPEGDLPDTFIPLLSTSNRLLEVLSAKADHTNMSSLLNTPISLSLTHLYLTGFMENEAFATIGQLKNLTTFSLFSCLYTFDDHILELKQLSKLEHLHLCCSGQDCDISPDGLVELFRLPSKNPSNFFPFRLKYLCFMDCYSFNLEVVTELSKSCPGLESLCVAHDEFMDEEAFSMLITNFRKLRFLDISGLGEMKCSALRHLADDELPELRFLSLHDTKVEEKMLRTLNLKRPELFVTTRPGFFISWSLQDGKVHFNDKFDGDINAVLNDLAETDGFCCMRPVVVDSF